MSISDYVHDAGYYTMAETAQMIGRSHDTLRRWIRDGDVEPTTTMHFGEIAVPVFSTQKIAALKEYAKTVKPGRKPKPFGPAARDKRGRLVSLDTYQQGEQ